MRTWIVVAAVLAAGNAGLVASTAGAQDTSRAQQRDEKASSDELRGQLRQLRQLRFLGSDEVQIGVSIRDVDAASGKQGGVEVTSVADDSPAAKAGVQRGDVFVEFDGEQVRSARQLSRLVEETAPGREVQAVVLRGGSRTPLKLTPARASAWRGDNDGEPFALTPDMRRFHFDVPMQEWSGPAQPPGIERRGRLGLTIQDLSPQLAEYFGTKSGVLVTTVRSDSPAGRAGLKAGDVITSVNDTPIKDPSDLSRAVSLAEGDVKIGYTRDRTSATATVKLEPRERPETPADPI